MTMPRTVIPSGRAPYFTSTFHCALFKFLYYFLCLSLTCIDIFFDLFSASSVSTFPVIIFSGLAILQGEEGKHTYNIHSYIPKQRAMYDQAKERNTPVVELTHL